MNIVKELRKKKGIQQKTLALEIGVSCPTVSAWESQKKDPSGERLKKLAGYFNVDELFILGYGLEKPTTFIPENPKTSGTSETEQIVKYVLDRLNDNQPKTVEARIISGGVDKMTKEQRELALNVLKTVFAQYGDYFERGTEENDS